MNKALGLVITVMLLASAGIWWSLRQMEPRAIVVAVPVTAAQTCDEFRSEVDDIVCLRTPEPFQAVGLWYLDFSQTTDEEVHELLDRASSMAKGA